MHRDDPRHFEDHVAIQTTDFDFDDVDRRLGWTEPGEPPAATQLESSPCAVEPPAAPDKDLCASLANAGSLAVSHSGQDAVVRVLAMLVDSSDYRLTLFTLVSAFGLVGIHGGKSFRNLSTECGVTVQAYSKRVLKLQETFHLKKTAGQKCEAAQTIYSQTQKAIWKKSERRKKGGQADFNIGKIARVLSGLQYLDGKGSATAPDENSGRTKSGAFLRGYNPRDVRQPAA